MLSLRQYLLRLHRFCKVQATTGIIASPTSGFCQFTLPNVTDIPGSGDKPVPKYDNSQVIEIPCNSIFFNVSFDIDQTSDIYFKIYSDSSANLSVVGQIGVYSGKYSINEQSRSSKSSLAQDSNVKVSIISTNKKMDIMVNGAIQASIDVFASNYANYLSQGKKYISFGSQFTGSNITNIVANCINDLGICSVIPMVTTSTDNSNIDKSTSGTLDKTTTSLISNSKTNTTDSNSITYTPSKNQTSTTLNSSSNSYTYSTTSKQEGCTDEEIAEIFKNIGVDTKDQLQYLETIYQRRYGPNPEEFELDPDIQTLLTNYVKHRAMVIKCKLINVVNPTGSSTNIKSQSTSTAGPSPTGPSTTGQSTGGPSTSGQSSGGPSSAGPSTGEPSTGGPSTGGPSTGGPSTGGPSTGGPSTGGPLTGMPSTGGPSTGGPSTGGPSSAVPTASGSPTSGQSTNGPSPTTTSRNPFEDKCSRSSIRYILRRIGVRRIRDLLYFERLYNLRYGNNPQRLRINRRTRRMLRRYAKFRDILIFCKIINPSISSSISMSSQSQTSLSTRPTTYPPSSAGPSTGEPSSGEPSSGGPSTGGPSTGGPSTGGPSSAVPTTSGSPTSGQSTNGPSPTTTSRNPFEDKCSRLSIRNILRRIGVRRIRDLLYFERLYNLRYGNNPQRLRINRRTRRMLRRYA
ncbi:hypothetical protein AYI70_g7380, partial [Smittium culicis]